jgi:hypothetical protein
MIQNYFVLSAAQRTASMAFNTPDVAIDPRAVDGATPGVSLNLNDNATGIGPGDPVALTGMYLAPKRIIDDPDYVQYAPDMVTYLQDKPFGLCEDETVFAPPPEL